MGDTPRPATCAGTPNRSSGRRSCECTPKRKAWRGGAVSAQVSMSHRLVSKSRATQGVITAAASASPLAHFNQAIRHSIKGDPDLNRAADRIDIGQKFASTLTTTAKPYLINFRVAGKFRKTSFGKTDHY